MISYWILQQSPDKMLDPFHVLCASVQTMRDDIAKSLRTEIGIAGGWMVREWSNGLKRVAICVDGRRYECGDNEAMSYGMAVIGL